MASAFQTLIVDFCASLNVVPSSVGQIDALEMELDGDMIRISADEDSHTARIQVAILDARHMEETERFRRCVLLHHLNALFRQDRNEVIVIEPEWDLILDGRFALESLDSHTLTKHCDRMISEAGAVRNAWGSLDGYVQALEREQDVDRQWSDERNFASLA